ncbi:hypothetical protein [Propionicimonas sp.]|uniref:hypothetical protein n=1 Tax=Propionicimonas sp. TaxID=1955623 RepID=UPI0017D433AC|nr:hypothetical protein [Propionicimonas sp.]MBU3975772.1 hypothetical protein [Actinomycetota bacterium]MBA3022238.1 hypothetical protein [Propionicimonas sp.]MBU3987662.1 hypothetical protein [Actinomycetota bacterium]MBU4007696.1 hypothetical protein [Actinomycetota bacterium]MBU4065338.1 hypothetical protein [Actinomycetota bacterium]
MPQLPDTAGSARARMRLIAVLLLIPITAYWAVASIWLLFLPEGSSGAAYGVLVGAVLLVWTGLYALATWGVFKRSRGLHILAIVMAAIGLLQPMSGATAWLNWLLAAGSLTVLVLLALTIPVGKAKG